MKPKKNRRLEGWRVSRKQKSEDRRQEGRSQKTEVRRQRVGKSRGQKTGRLAKHQKRKGSRIQGFKGSSCSLGIFFKK